MTQPFLTEPTIAALGAALRSGTTSSETLLLDALRRVAEPSGEGASTFISVYERRALDDARAADQRRMRGEALSALDGIPISIKDLFDVAGDTTLAGSKVLRGAAVADADAVAVARLRRAGAVIVGRTNMTEFAFSGLGINPHYGTPLNPFERGLGRIPGGSSSGAAVSVSDGMCAAGMGSDTGGSVRIPAAFCGLTGFKPTASRIARTGALPLSTTLDSVGVIARSVRCCAAVDAALADGPPLVRDETSTRLPRLCVARNYVLEAMDPLVEDAFARALWTLAAAGATIVERNLPQLDELSGINGGGGFAAAEAYEWHESLLNQHGGDYDPRVSVRIRRGQRQTAADYLRLLRARGDWIARMEHALSDVDAWLMPTVPIVAPALAPLIASDDLYAQINQLVLRNPSVINMLDGCAVSLPCQEQGTLPVGLSVAGCSGRDADVLAIAAWVEAKLKNGEQRKYGLR
jgi:aspartyl-tRNA(Asn)/glutamyl-tRNA(Gln) amidotransferase subunit A